MEYVAGLGVDCSSPPHQRVPRRSVVRVLADRARARDLRMRDGHLPLRIATPNVVLGRYSNLQLVWTLQNPIPYSIP